MEGNVLIFEGDESDMWKVRRSLNEGTEGVDYRVFSYWKDDFRYEITNRDEHFYRIHPERKPKPKPVFTPVWKEWIATETYPNPCTGYTGELIENGYWASIDADGNVRFHDGEHVSAHEYSVPAGATFEEKAKAARAVWEKEEEEKRKADWD